MLSAVDEAQRFEGEQAVANYGALAATIYQSGTVRQLGRINRDSRGEVRRVLLQCAHTVVRMKSAGGDAAPTVLCADCEATGEEDCVRGVGAQAADYGVRHVEIWEAL